MVSYTRGRIIWAGVGHCGAALWLREGLSPVSNLRLLTDVVNDERSGTCTHETDRVGGPERASWEVVVKSCKVVKTACDASYWWDKSIFVFYT